MWVLISVFGLFIVWCGIVDVVVLGGDVIGLCGFDLYVEGLVWFGVSVYVDYGYFIVEVLNGFVGVLVLLDFLFVGVIENVLMVVVFVCGMMVIENVVCEFEVVDFVCMFVLMGV